MYKRITQIAALSLGMLAMTSCATYVSHDVKVNNMDSITYSGTVGFEDNAEAAEFLGSFTEDFESNLEFEKQQYESNDFKKEGVVGKTYTFKNLTLDDYSKIDSSFTLEKIDGEVVFTTSVDDDSVEPKFNQVSITMPGKVTSAEGAININGKTATWDANNYNGDRYIIVSKDKTSPLIPLAGGAVIVLLGVGAFLYIRKGKNSSIMSPESDESEITEEK